MSYAMWLLEGLRASQVTVNSEQLTINNTVQFPSETLLFRSGSARDLALLFAGCLEGVGISSALISVGSESSVNELLVAVSLDINASQAETLFNGTDKILIIDGNVWLPLSMSALDQGFMASWNRGDSVLNSVFASGGFAEFVVIRHAWENFPPAPLFELGRSGIRTDDTAALREVNDVMQQYIQQELTPIIQRTVNAPNSAAQQNRLGILYIRAGRIADAKRAYERAVGLGSVPAMTNLGNLAITEGDFNTAEKHFNQALLIEPQNRAALRGLERITESR